MPYIYLIFSPFFPPLPSPFPAFKPHGVVCGCCVCSQPWGWVPRPPNISPNYSNKIRREGFYPPWGRNSAGWLHFEVFPGNGGWLSRTWNSNEIQIIFIYLTRVLFFFRVLERRWKKLSGQDSFILVVNILANCHISKAILNMKLSVSYYPQEKCKFSEHKHD